MNFFNARNPSTCYIRIDGYQAERNGAVYLCNIEGDMLEAGMLVTAHGERSPNVDKVAAKDAGVDLDSNGMISAHSLAKICASASHTIRRMSLDMRKMRLSRKQTIPTGESKRQNWNAF